VFSNVLYYIHIFNIYRNPMHNLHRHNLGGTGQAPMKELNSALGDALAGFNNFDVDDNDQNNRAGPNSNLIIDENPKRHTQPHHAEEAAAAGPIKLKLKMFGKPSLGDSINADNHHFSTTNSTSLDVSEAPVLLSSPAGSKLISSIARTKPLSATQQKERAAMLFGSHGTHAANERMTKVHQDDDYVYPSLDLSDDEMEIGPTTLQGSNAGRDKGGDGDSAWCPKMRVRNLAVNQRLEPRPSRENAKKVAAVEMGLKMAAEKRRKSSALAVSPNSLHFHSSHLKSSGSIKSGKSCSTIKKKKIGTPALLPSSPFLINNPMTSSTVGLTTAAGSDSDSNTNLSEAGQTPLLDTNSVGAPSSSAKNTGSLKPKKGLLTAKQRLGKILKLKF